MSRRTAVIEEEFDDDTDLPLPVASIPNLGTRGALLEAISDDEGDSEPGPATPSNASFAGMGAGGIRPGAGVGGGAHVNQVTDITPYKKWICVYPIYIDAKRAYGTGQRRIPREKALWWPLSRDMAEAAGRLGFGTLHEANKFHPRDWENPGRVRVQLKKEGKLVNSAVRNKKELLELISLQIQMVKPDNKPRPPYTTTSTSTSTTTAPSYPSRSSTPTPSTPAKGKQPASKTAGKGASSGTTVAPSSVVATKRLPVPPAPHPPLASRVSPFSPALVSGVLVDTVKAGMSAPDPMSGIAGGGGGKGKRKVVRVRQ